MVLRRVQTSAKDKPVNPELGAYWKEVVAALAWSHCRGLRRTCPQADLIRDMKPEAKRVQTARVLLNEISALAELRRFCPNLRFS